MTRRLLALLVAATLGAAGTSANAQGWIKMPNGSLSYMANYTTSGLFSCGNPKYILGKCLALGNSVTVWTRTSSATITYNPVSSTLVAPSTHSKSIGIGSLQTTFSGTGPNRYPQLIAPGARLFNLQLGITTTSPMIATGTLAMSFSPRPQGLVALSYYGTGNTTRIAVAPPPAPATYSGIAVGGLNYPVLDNFDEVENLSVNVSVTPEPATLALLGTGLVGVFGMARRRAKNRD